MFEEFTDSSRRVVVLAREEARLLDHDYMGTEHLLLGLLHEGEGVAARALTALGLSLEAVRRRVEETVGRGHSAPGGHIPFTARAKHVLQECPDEARQLGQARIGTEHILLALIRENESLAVDTLVKLGTNLDQLRQHVIGFTVTK